MARRASRCRCRRARSRCWARCWPGPASWCPRPICWTRAGRTRSSPRRRCSKPSTSCASRSATTGRPRATSRPSTAAAIASSRRLRRASGRGPRSGAAARPRGSTPGASSSSRRSSAGPSGGLSCGAARWAAAATVLTSLLVAAFGPRPVDLPPSHFSIALAVARCRCRSSAARCRPHPTAAASRSSRSSRWAPGALPARGQPVPAGPASTRLTSRAIRSSRPTVGLIGYFAGGQLKVVAPGPPATRHRPGACPAPAPPGWMPSTIVFGGGPGGGLATRLARGRSARGAAPAAGALARRAVWLARCAAGRRGPALHRAHPDGQRRRDPRRRCGPSPRPRPRRRVRPLRARPATSSSNGNGQLAAAPFDLASRTLTGALRPVVDDVASASVFEGPRYAFSRSGSLVYVPGPAAGPLAVRWRTERWV